jgi:hypothetical protein
MNKPDAKELHRHPNSYTISKEAATDIIDQLAKHLEYRICMIKKEVHTSSIDLDDGWI